MSAQPGTTTTIQAGATLELTGDGGFYQGSAAGQGALTNNGVLRKSGGTGTSVVDATYSGSGQVVVQTGTLALPDGGLVGAVVSPGYHAGHRSVRRPVDRVDVSADAKTPPNDPMSVNLRRSPGANAGRRPPSRSRSSARSAPAVDPTASATRCWPTPTTWRPTAPTRRRSRCATPRPDVMATPLDEVQVVHTTDDRPARCCCPTASTARLPSGLWSCVHRPVARNGQNTFVTVLTTQTSRWRVRRSLPVENQGARPRPGGSDVKEAKPLRRLGPQGRPGRRRPPSGGGAGRGVPRLRRRQAAWPRRPARRRSLKNPGPGKHTISVAAVNARRSRARRARRRSRWPRCPSLARSRRRRARRAAS